MKVRPRVRFVEAIPVEGENGEPLAVIRDPEDLLPEATVVPLPTLVLMTLLDGTRELRDVQAVLQREYGALVPLDQLQEMLAELDALWLLENETSEARRREVIAEFAALKSRPAVHSGTAYPDEPSALTAFLDSHFSDANGPGRVTELRPAAPAGLVTPHIDLRSGGPCMAHAFARLVTSEPPDLYIILGVAHHPTENLFTLTVKDFETPLGPAPVHAEAAARLSELYGAERLSGEFAHKNEHSVEFQAVYLRHLHGAEHRFRILPLLCGSLHEHYTKPGAPISGNRDVADFVAALRTVIAEFGPRVCVIAGVDLSHVGLKFGDAKGVDDFRAGLIGAADRRMLETVAARDPEAFFDHFREDRNARNVDAVCAVYVMLHALAPDPAKSDPANGDATTEPPNELLAYDQYRELETESLVSFASMALYNA